MKYISINRVVIARNLYLHRRDPVTIIEQDGREVQILGPSRVVYRPDKPDDDDPKSTA